jgi:hypothetical protein
VCFETSLDCVIEEDGGKLTMGKGKSPETEIRSCVGDGTENEFDGLNQLMDEEIREGSIMTAVTCRFTPEEILQLVLRHGFVLFGSPVIGLVLVFDLLKLVFSGFLVLL